MSFYTFIVLEVKKEVFSRLFDHWVSEEVDWGMLYRPRITFETEGTFVMTFKKNRAPPICDYDDWLSFTLGSDDGDFCIEMYPGPYVFESERKDGKK